MSFLPGWYPGTVHARPATITQTERQGTQAKFNTWTYSNADLGSTGTACIGIYSNNGNITAVTVDGVTPVGSTIISSSTSRIYFGIARGVSSTGDVVITTASGGERAGFVIWQVEGDLVSETPTDSDSSAASDPTLTIDEPGEGFIVGIAHPGNADGNTSWSGLTEEWDEALDGGRNWSGATGEFSADDAGQSVTVTYSSEEPTNRCAAVVAFR